MQPSLHQLDSSALIESVSCHSQSPSSSKRLIGANVTQNTVIQIGIIPPQILESGIENLNENSIDIDNLDSLEEGNPNETGTTKPPSPTIFTLNHIFQYEQAKGIHYNTRIYLTFILFIGYYVDVSI